MRVLSLFLLLFSTVCYSQTDQVFTERLAQIAGQHSVDLQLICAGAHQFLFAE